MSPFTLLRIGDPVISIMLTPHSCSHIVLTENPLRCDCELSWVPDYIMETLATVSDSATCSAPEHIRGRFVNSLQAEEFVCGKYGSISIRGNALRAHTRTAL